MWRQADLPERWVHICVMKVKRFTLLRMLKCTQERDEDDGEVAELPIKKFSTADVQGNYLVMANGA